MESLVQEQLDAYNAHDLERFCACYHPEVQVIRLLSNQVTVSGLTAFREGYAALFAANPKLHCELRSRIVLAASVIDEGFVTGFLREPQGFHTAAIYSFRDGLIDRVWFPRS